MLPQLNPPAMRIRHTVPAPELHLAVEIGGRRAELAPETDRQRLRHGRVWPIAAVPVRSCVAATADRKFLFCARAAAGGRRFCALAGAVASVAIGRAHV